MSAAIGSESRWHIRGVRLPDGEQVEEWWVADGVWHSRPIPGARELPGSWILPGGLVDAHAHLSMNFSGLGHPDGSAELMAANLDAQLAAGVLAVRDAGLAWGAVALAERPQGPRVQWSGRLLSAPGRGYPAICEPVSAEDLAAVGVAEVRAGASWVKIMGDFPGPDGNWFAAPPIYPEAAVRELVYAVHAAGGRVLAHTTGLAAAMLVRAGVDSLEHGMALDEALVREMAVRGIAWSLTMGTALKHTGAIAEEPGPAGAAVRGALDRQRELLPLAASLGVPLLSGSDELGHGELVQELTTLRRFGLTAAQIIAAASTGARAFLGLPAQRPGAPADVTTYTNDPRRDLGALRRPAAVLVAGELVQG